MLVLTRRNDQSIVFPELDVSIQVLRVRGNIVKIGVEAPDEVTVLRKEVLDDPSCEAPPSRWKEQRHALRNRLHTANVALHLLQKKSEAGRLEDVESTLNRVVEELRALDEMISSPHKPVSNEVTAPRNGAATTASRRALLVEDDANQSELLAGYLELSGFSVTVAGDGGQALEELASGELPDVVLLDMRMPRVGGAETIARIRRDPALERLKVYAISGTNPDELGVPEGPRGVDRWFRKPLNPASLVRALRTELAPATNA